MDDTKVIMEALSKMGVAGQKAFIVWCIKEVSIWWVWPVVISITGYTIYRVVLLVHGTA